MPKSDFKIRRATASDTEAQLRLFDQATERHKKRPVPPSERTPSNRGWKREDLYARGRPH